jgi:NitT/TauT family transport system ATP-binding protein
VINPGGTVATGVRCECLSCTYAGARGLVHALEDVSFAIGPSEFVSIVGPSGCGKSTLLRIIAGLQAQTSGRVVRDDHEPAAPSRGGLVVQENGTFPWMSIVDNVAFGLEMQGVTRETRRARAQEYLDRVGLGRYAGFLPHELSVGMRQRVGIGRAFVSGAPILLMDEPFGALDAQTRWTLQAELLRVWRLHPRPVLFVTHDVTEAVILADRVIVMSGQPGRVRAEIPVALPRPRDPRTPSLEALELTRRIWDLLDEPGLEPEPVGAR